MNRLSLFLKSTIVSLILFSFLSCGNSESEKCSEVERYLDKQENDSAINLFKTINYSELYDDEVACELTIQYGGSMKPANATELTAMEEIDGGLIGGSSLKADEFMQIIDF